MLDDNREDIRVQRHPGAGTKCSICISGSTTSDEEHLRNHVLSWYHSMCDLERPRSHLANRVEAWHRGILGYRLFRRVLRRLHSACRALIRGVPLCQAA